MENFKTQDPRTFNLPNKDRVKEVIKLFFDEQKEKFLNAYYKLSNSDKFYTISVCILECSNINMSKKMFLEELRPDLEALRILNKPSNTNLNFGYDYTGYDSADKEIWNRISLAYFDMNFDKNTWLSKNF